MNEILPMNSGAASSGFKLGVLIMVLLALFALLTPWLHGIDGSAQNLEASLKAPAQAFPLGTDLLGRDFLARLAQATQTSLGIGFFVALSTGIFGLLLAFIAGFSPDWADRLICFGVDACAAIPPLLQILLIASLFSTLNFNAIESVYIALTATLWVEYFRLFRVVIKTVLSSDAVEASRLLGFNVFYIARRHILPEIAERWLLLVTLGTAQAVLMIAALGFISVGVSPPHAELGQLMTEGLVHFQEAPWLMLFPIFIVFAFVAALALLTTKSID
jgi:peptide/nickel transport system permease protein